MTKHRQGEPRVVISVSGGVAEENTVLAVGPVHVYIVDFDNLKDSTPEQKAATLAGLPFRRAELGRRRTCGHAAGVKRENRG